MILFPLRQMYREWQGLRYWFVDNSCQLLTFRASFQAQNSYSAQLFIHLNDSRFDFELFEPSTQ
jgi:hypothetical protein